MSFSAVENVEELYKADENSALNMMYGIKYFLMFFIIMGHSVVLSLIGPVYDYRKVELVNI